jgi:mannose-1-phosphate guanylyltransferase
MNFVAFVLAGGTGTRFWPLSRRSNPKQLLSIGDHPVMIRDTLDRLEGFLGPDRIFVITAAEHADALREEVEEIPDENIIVEPEGRDTAACAGLTGIVTKKRFDEDTAIGFFPADHRIEDHSAFRNATEKAVEGCLSTEGIITFGIEPDKPATGYGYIIPDDDGGNQDHLKKVKRFTEKPNRDRATSFIEQQSALWNSGMFFWSTRTILREIESSLPDLYDGLREIARDWDSVDSLNEALNRTYPSLPKTSVDYGIIENSDNIWTLPVEFNWNDLGTWDTVEVLLDPDDCDNHVEGEASLLDVSDSVIVNQDGPFVGAIGMHSTIIVSTEDALLVCPKNRAEDVKKLVNSLQNSGREDLL